MNSLLKSYQEELPNLQQKLGLKHKLAVPKITKVVVNMGVHDAVTDKNSVEKASEILGQITGQKPKITRAKKSIAGFKLREGEKVGVAVTLRGDRMYEFLDKLVKIVLPRIRDFRGVSRTSFDGQGNYSLGLAEFTVFPEIDAGKVDRVQGLEISIVTTAKNNEQGLLLLETLQMPFKKEAKA